MKHYVVTGVSSGIGLSLARLLVGQGHHVFGSVRRQDDAERVGAELGSGFTPLIMDLTDASSIAKAAQTVREALDGKRLTGLVNNAGMVTHGPLLEMPMERIGEQLDTNLLGTLRVIRAFAPLLGLDTSLSGEAGRVVNISAGTATVVPPFAGSYGMTAAAIDIMSDALRRELLLAGIDVVIFAVGNTATPLWDKADDDNMENYRNSIFFEALMRFRMRIIEYGRHGLTAEYVSSRIAKALSARRPRAKYLVSPNIIANQYWPRLLPRRRLDQVLARALGLLPPKD